LSLTVSTQLLKATKSTHLEEYRNLTSIRQVDREYAIDVARLPEEGLEDIIAASKRVKDSKTERAGEAILLARTGKFNKAVPNFKAFQGVLEAFLKADLLDGWVYVTEEDGKLYPQLVCKITFDDGRHARGAAAPAVTLHTISYGYSNEGRGERKPFRSCQHTHRFAPQQVTRRQIVDALSDLGIYKETHALREAHDVSMARHRKVTMNAFSHQFRVNGAAYQYEDENYRRRGLALTNRKIIHDLEAADYGAFARHADSELFDDHSTHAGVGEVPEHPLVRCFDLKTHEFFWVHGDNLTPYEYDKSLRDKLILPQTHRDLLDVLTTNLDAFVSDIIEGKSAGNVILCKGIAGVGKTLTAEVYAELIERPLYAIHSGNLGTTAEDIDKNLQRTFLQAKRWDCVLLLDEADVFVVQRGNNIEQNAIVAEFLRTLEYFDGLLFMTTNRPDDIDEAIISRCAAVISYVPPSATDAVAIWGVMANQYKVKLDSGLVANLVALFPKIAPRDIKMLFRLALRVSTSRKEALTEDTFRRCAMFRAIEMQPEAVSRGLADSPRRKKGAQR
jgi:hypothetical protein